LFKKGYKKFSTGKFPLLSNLSVQIELTVQVTRVSLYMIPIAWGEERTQVAGQGWVQILAFWLVNKWGKSSRCSFSGPLC